MFHRYLHTCSIFMCICRIFHYVCYIHVIIFFVYLGIYAKIHGILYVSYLTIPHGSEYIVRSTAILMAENRFLDEYSIFMGDQLCTCTKPFDYLTFEDVACKFAQINVELLTEKFRKNINIIIIVELMI